MLKTARTKVFKIFTRSKSDSRSFSRYPEFGPLEITDYDDFLLSSKKIFEDTWRKPVEYCESLKYFDFIQIIGEGMFSKVVLVNHLQKEEFFAMKIIEKQKIVKNKQLHHELNEKCVLQGLNHPFAVHLVSFFMDNSYIYFVLPFIPCGELFKHLKELKRFNETQARFYLAQVVLALEYLHYLELIYRDLKPENVLIDHTGYLKLTDFGFCKRVKGRTYTFCGTPQYLAPEMILGKGYGATVDWWALGVFTFELAAGRSPFNDLKMEDLYENILECRYRMANYFSAELQNLIKNLLQKDLTKRLGNLKGGVKDVKDHRWFRPVNWMAILNRNVPADYIPHWERSEGRSDEENEGSKEGVCEECLKSKLCKVDSEDKYKALFADF